MPADYAGNPTSINPHDAPIITCPVDGDPRTAQSVNAPLQKLADFSAYLQRNAALLPSENFFEANQTISNASGIRWVNTQTFGNETNPGCRVPVANEQRAKNLCKVWGRFDRGGGIVDGFNIDSVTLLENNTILRINFAAPLASDRYAVICSESAHWISQLRVLSFNEIIQRTDRYFTMGMRYVDFINNTSYLQDVSRIYFDFSFCIFGEQHT